jgi:hypothetical protein
VSAGARRCRCRPREPVGMSPMRQFILQAMRPDGSLASCCRSTAGFWRSDRGRGEGATFFPAHDVVRSRQIAFGLAVMAKAYVGDQRPHCARRNDGPWDIHSPFARRRLRGRSEFGQSSFIFDRREQRGPTESREESSPCRNIGFWRPDHRAIAAHRQTRPVGTDLRRLRLQRADRPICARPGHLVALSMKFHPRRLKAWPVALRRIPNAHLRGPSRPSSFSALKMEDA